MKLLKEFNIKESYIRYKGTIYQRNYYYMDDSWAWYTKGNVFLDIHNDFVKELENEYQKLIKEIKMNQSFDYKIEELEKLYQHLLN